MFIKRHRTHTRRGAAVVEMAVVAPLLLLLVLGTVEMGWMLLVRHTVSMAAREGARASTLPSATLAEVQGKVDAAMPSPATSPVLPRRMKRFGSR